MVYPKRKLEKWRTRNIYIFSQRLFSLVKFVFQDLHVFVVCLLCLTGLSLFVRKNG